MGRLKRMLGQRLRRRPSTQESTPGLLELLFFAMVMAADVVAFWKVFHGGDRAYLNHYYQPVTFSGGAVCLAIINLAMIWYVGSSYWHKWRRRRRP